MNLTLPPVSHTDVSLNFIVLVSCVLSQIADMKVCLALVFRALCDMRPHRHSGQGEI